MWFSTGENEFKKFEPVPLPIANVTNALLDQNRRMEGLTLANSSNVPFMQNRRIDYTGQNPFNVPGDNNKQMGLVRYVDVWWLFSPYFFTTLIIH